jgi:hypothetical protein
MPPGSARWCVALPRDMEEMIESESKQGDDDADRCDSQVVEDALQEVSPHTHTSGSELGVATSTLEKRGNCKGLTVASHDGLTPGPSWRYSTRSRRR